MTKDMDSGEAEEPFWKKSIESGTYHNELHEKHHYQEWTRGL